LRAARYRTVFSAGILPANLTFAGAQEKCRQDAGAAVSPAEAIFHLHSSGFRLSCNQSVRGSV
jgi:hypothetical protein